MRSQIVSLEEVRSVYVLDQGWVNVRSIRDQSFLIGGVPHNGKQGRRGFAIVTTDGEEIFVTPRMLEAVSREAVAE